MAILCRGHFFCSLLTQLLQMCTVPPGLSSARLPAVAWSCSSWSWESGLGWVVLMAQPLQKAVGLCVRGGLPLLGSVPLLWPSPSSSIRSLSFRGSEVGVHASTLPAAPLCFLRKGSCESGFNLVSLALYLAEIPQSWWHIDGTLSCVPNAEADSPYFYTALVLSVTFRRR